MVVTWNDNMVFKIREAALRGVMIGTSLILAEGNRLIQTGPKSGRIYTRRGVKHQASAPGQPPATDRGRLVQSGRTEFDQSLLLGVALWSVDYAPPLEFGSSKMEPRPFARPALQNKRSEALGAISSQIRMVL